ncbi:hypothetical protein [Pelagicoccus albus]|uniref:Polyketide cyclase / dehydrase and lipid transport n=1 Tax=Pelagicoccus albus TaxID=415222 RepID=A0A7X1B7L1_9BACT|nr:hypothetical protein [Pelagicoccus albus]MBC2605863.1 hypothetical protein [Pelagicoccus albus]
MKNRIFSRIENARTKVLGLSALAVLAASTTFGAVMDPSKVEKPAAEEAAARRLVVNINDIRGIVDFESERVREDLLRSAFYDAADRSDWLGEFDFNYNSNKKSESPGSLDINVLNWRLSRTGIYEFTASATYWNNDGERVNLGLFHGSRMSLPVTNIWHSGEQFVDSAEDAFKDSLKKLKEIVVES